MTSDSALDRQREYGSADFTRTWRFRLGMMFFALSIIFPVFALIVPALGLPLSWSAALAGAFVVGGPEVMLVLAAVFLGREGVVYYKKRTYAFLKRPAGPVRYYACLVLMLVSGTLPWWLHTYLEHWLPGAMKLQLTILAGANLLFILCFVLAGPELWRKFIALFAWEGAAEPDEPEDEAEVADASPTPPADS